MAKDVAPQEIPPPSKPQKIRRKTPRSVKYPTELEALWDDKPVLYQGMVMQTLPEKTHSPRYLLTDPYYRYAVEQVVYELNEERLKAVKRSDSSSVSSQE